MDPITAFHNQNKKEINLQGKNKKMNALALEFLKQSGVTNYSYHFNWLGRPIIQLPQDIVAIQELIWRVKPDCIIETGIAHGGSLILSSSMIELLHNKGKVIGIDIDIRPHNKKEIVKHPMYKNIMLLQGSSIDPTILKKIRAITKKFHTIMVFLGSNHTHSHVLKELELYAPLVTPGSYIVAFDTIVQFMPNTLFKNRPWKKGNNPYTAVQAFLKENHNFKSDNEITSKLLLTCAPGGFLKRIK